MNHNFERFRPYLSVLARCQHERRVQAKFDPSDVVQQTLLQAHRAADTFEGDNDAQRAAWLRQILVRTLQHELRDLGRDKRNVRREKSLQTNLDASSIRMENWLVDNQTPPPDRAEKHELLLQMAESLESLSDDQREAIILHYLNGYKLAEIATQMNRSMSSVAGLLHRGLAALRTALR